MKFLAVLSALVIRCAASKSWNSDSYSEETFSVFGWFSYLKRLSLLTLMLSGVVLYYIPESRPHARRICYAFIDFTANGLKCVLAADESKYEEIKSKHHRSRPKQAFAVQRRHSREIPDADVNEEHTQKNREKKAKTSIMFMKDDALTGCLEKKKSGKCGEEHNRNHRHSRHRSRSTVVKDILEEPCMEIAKSIYFHSDKLKDIQKYLKMNLYGGKQTDTAAVEDYAVLISGSPRQMAMLDQKYDKEDLVILQDPCLRMEYKECATSTEKLSTKGTPGIDLKGPTTDYNDRATDSEMDTYAGKEIELFTVPEGNNPRLFESIPSYQTSQYQCGAGCCSGNGCSVSSTYLDNEDINSNFPLDKNVLKSSKSMVTRRTRKNLFANGENYTSTCNVLKDRKVVFRTEDKKEHMQTREEVTQQQENTRTSSGKKLKINRLINYCNDAQYSADDEYSQREGCLPIQNDLDETPEREGQMIYQSSDDTIFDDNEDFYTKPILKNRLKPVLLRAVNWIFGGCQEASKRAQMKQNQVEKEEIREFTNEWLL